MERIDETNVDSKLHARYREREALVENYYPKSLPKLREGGRIIFFQDDVAKAGLADAQLVLMGALVRVAAYHGDTIMIGRYRGVTLSGYDIPEDE